MMALACLLGLAVVIRVTLAAVDDCPKSQFWNGTLCISCSPCPPGFGVKTKCSAKKNTECIACHPGFDYSSTNGFERCFGCDEFSNCPLGNSKEVKKCTVDSPRVCDGCQDGNYLYPSTGCQTCSPPCRFDQDETTPCTTEHDRTCAPKTTVSTTSTISSTRKEVPKSVPGTSGVDTVGTETPPTRTDRVSPLSQKTSAVENPVLWVVISVVVTAAAFGTIFGYRKRKRKQKRRRKLRGANIRTDTDTRNTQEMFPLMPRGLDLPIKDLSIDGKTFIAHRLNGKGNYGYYYWQSTAEKLGFLEECKAWETAENPTEKLLKAYGEKAGSTIRNLIKALKDPEVGLTQFANEIEEKFSTSTTQDQNEGAVVVGGANDVSGVTMV